MIAIIAGTGSLPAQACKSLIKQKKDFFIISLFPQDNLEALKQVTPPTTKIIQEPFYKAKAILTLLKKQKTKQILFIGKVDKQNLLKKFKLDWFAVKMLATLSTKSDMSIMNKIETIAKDNGFELIHQHEILGGLLVQPGVLTGELTPTIQENISMGLAVAEQMSTCDIGQTIVIKDKMILAVEAIEGTDACIKRGVTLGGKNIIVCKSANINHNNKFDLPTIGSETLKNITKGEIQAIAWKSDQTFIADKEEFIAKAKTLGITLVSVTQ
ncbi:UDP-2,3-diacylglucosamine diphosphatase LpxI [Candidatus Dependentiae bacterium]|nr:UDP-2,3-diacylglucosamine diphosphatase LpxI [Candidatus Dependentiae bacterium]